MMKYLLKNTLILRHLHHKRRKPHACSFPSCRPAGTKGNIINLSRQAIINDDLGAFVGLAATLGRAAGRTVEADVYALLALNSGLGPVMSDGKTLFHADHGNITTAAALTMAAVDADRVAMAQQKDVSGNDYLDLRPAVLLVPIGLGGTARQEHQRLTGGAKTPRFHVNSLCCTTPCGGSERGKQ